MKTQITIETNRNQEIMIGLNGTGELYKASRADIAAYFDGYVATELERLQAQATAFVKATAARRDLEV